jgi:hypothetical protein
MNTSMRKDTNLSTSSATWQPSLHWPISLLGSYQKCVLKKQSWYELIWDDVRCVKKNIYMLFFFGFNVFSMSIIKVLVDTAVPSAHDILIWSEIGAKLISRSEIESVHWQIAVREHLFKKKVKNRTIVKIIACTDSAEEKVIRCNFKPGSVERSIADWSF